MSDTMSATSRPQLQRTEFGPMINAFSHQIYDDVEQRAIAQLDQFPYPSNIRELGEFCSQLNVLVEESEESSKSQDPYLQLEDYINTHYEPKVFAGDEFKSHVSLTTGEAAPVMHEALLSGIAVPAQLYRVVRPIEYLGVHERIDIDTGRGQVPVSPIEAAATLTSSRFTGMLNELAKGPNGYLGRNSTVTKLASAYSLGCFYLGGGDQLTDDFFEQASDGTVIGFSSKFIQRTLEQTRKANASERAVDHTGGCPVRHQQTCSVGEAAAEYLRDNNLTPGEPVLTRGAQLISTLLTASVVKKSELKVVV